MPTPYLTTNRIIQRSIYKKVIYMRERERDESTYKKLFYMRERDENLEVGSRK